MSLAERLQLSPSELDVNACVRSVDKARPADARPQAKHDAYERMVSWSLLAADCFYVLERPADATAYARKAINGIREYFFGDWLYVAPDCNGDAAHKWWLKRMLWSRMYIRSVAWASTMSLWDDVAKIARFPSEQSIVDDDIETNALCLSLAQILRGETLGAHIVEPLLQSRKKRYRIPAEGLIAIAGNDAKSLQSAIESYLVESKKRGFRDDHLRLSHLATVLYYLGIHHGLVGQVPVLL